MTQEVVEETPLSLLPHVIELELELVEAAVIFASSKSMGNRRKMLGVAARFGAECARLYQMELRVRSLR